MIEDNTNGIRRNKRVEIYRKDWRPIERKEKGVVLII